jgi:hypothetical protein
MLPEEEELAKVEVGYDKEVAARKWMTAARVFRYMYSSDSLNFMWWVLTAGLSVWDKTRPLRRNGVPNSIFVCMLAAW